MKIHILLLTLFLSLSFGEVLDASGCNTKCGGKNTHSYKSRCCDHGRRGRRGATGPTGPTGPGGTGATGATGATGGGVTGADFITAQSFSAELGAGFTGVFSTIDTFTSVIADGWDINAGSSFTNPDSGLYEVNYEINVGVGGLIGVGVLTNFGTRALLDGSEILGSQSSIASLASLALLATDLQGFQLNGTFQFNYTANSSLTFQFACSSLIAILGTCQLVTPDIGIPRSAVVTITRLA